MRNSHLMYRCQEVTTRVCLLPVILIGLVVGGLIYLAFPILIVVGIVGLLL